MENANSFLGEERVGLLMRKYSMPVSDLLTFLIAAVLIRKTYQELGTREERVMQNGFGRKEKLPQGF